MLIFINDVKENMVLEENIYKDGKLLLLSNTILDNNLIIKLRRLGVDKINILSTKEETIPSFLYESLRESLIKLNYQNLKISLKEVITKLENTKYLCYDLSRYYYCDDDLYNRAINVCIYSIILAKEYNERCLNRKFRINIEEIAISSILHNIGKLANDKTIFKSLSEILLDRDKFPGFDPLCFKRHNKDMHPLYAYSLLFNNELISKEAKTTILFSEENEKGTGALGVGTDLTKRKDATMTSSKIIHLAAIYDDLLFKVIKKEENTNNESPNNIYEILEYAKSNGLVNESLVDLLFSTIPLYPINTKVKLSDGKTATVIKLNEDVLDLPVVKRENNTIVDLSIDSNISISYIIPV